MSALASAWTTFVYSPMSLVWTLVLFAALLGGCALRDAIVTRLPKAKAARAADEARQRRLDAQHRAMRVKDDHDRGHCWHACPHCADARTVDFWSPMQPDAFAEDRARALAWEDRDYR